MCVCRNLLYPLFDFMRRGGVVCSKTKVQAYILCLIIFSLLRGIEAFKPVYLVNVL